MGAATGTCSSIVEETFGSTKLIAWTWIGGTAETALGSCTTTSFYTGKVIYFASDPGANVKAGHDVIIKDKNDIDILSHNAYGLGATTTASLCTGSLGAVANSQLELFVVDAGSAATETGIVYLWIR